MFIRTHRRLVSSFCVVIALAACGTASAQQFRLGYVNVDRVMRDSILGKRAEEALEVEFAVRAKAGKDQAQAFSSAVAQLEKDLPTLSDEQRLERQRRLGEQQRELNRVSEAFKADQERRRGEELQKLLEATSRAVKQVAETERFDAILQEIVYIKPTYDVTDKVLKTLDSPTSGNK
ncbi:OmpH family outer membrane protein [soil metagenome]